MQYEEPREAITLPIKPALEKKGIDFICTTDHAEHALAECPTSRDANFERAMKRDFTVTVLLATSPPTRPRSGACSIRCTRSTTSCSLSRPGADKKESDAVLAHLRAHIARPGFGVRWRWKRHDLAFWDNRLTQHYASADYLPHRRVMHRATILGDKPY